MPYHPIEPSYSQGLSDWFSSLYDYGYGGMPGEYDMTPEKLLSQWDKSKIPGSEGYEMYEGIFPTYPGFKEQYGVSNYLLNLEKMSQATESARGKLGRELALTGEDTTGGFYRAGAEEGQKLQKRETIADIMEDVIEQENIGKTGAGWQLASGVVGGRKDWEREVSDAYQRYLGTVVDPVGCTDPRAENYDSIAVTDGGRNWEICSYPEEEVWTPDFESLSDAAEAYYTGDLDYDDWQLLYNYYGEIGEAPTDSTMYFGHFGFPETCDDSEALNYGYFGDCQY